MHSYCFHTHGLHELSTVSILFMLMLLFMLHVHGGAFFQKCRQVAQLAGSVLSVAAALLVRSGSLCIRGQRRPEAAYPQRLAQRAAPVFAAACAGRLSRGQPVVPGADYQEAQQTPARALSRAYFKVPQRYFDINLSGPSHRWVQTLTVEGQMLQTNNHWSTPLGHRISAYQKLAPWHWSEPFCIVLSVLKDWGLQYQGMKLVHVSFFSQLLLLFFGVFWQSLWSNDFHSCISWKRHHWPGSQDRLSTVNSGSLVHQASAVTWQVWQPGDQLIWISRCHETCPNLLFFFLWVESLRENHMKIILKEQFLLNEVSSWRRRGILWWEAINLRQAKGDLCTLNG